MKQSNEFLKHNITREFLEECLEYRDGELYWKERPLCHFNSEQGMNLFNSKYAHKKAGCITPDGYIKINLRKNDKKIPLLAHRIIWFMLKNEYPIVIDHIDRNPSNNRIENLRNVTQFHNSINKDTFKGYVYNKKRDKYYAQTRMDGRTIFIGSFNTKEEAITAYNHFIYQIRNVVIDSLTTSQKVSLINIIKWFEQAKPKESLTLKDLSTQCGAHIEEFIEFLSALGEEIPQELITIKDKYYKGNISNEWTIPQKVEILDALADSVVTATGVAYFMGSEWDKALTEVNQSNFSKFENGKPILNQDGQIMKGTGYFKPNMEKFV